ncbi:MAG: TetR family transcriptional regulator C-terminal domain-containing protein, partial [Exilibacterium sp.]
SKRKINQIQRWIDNGEILPIDPQHLLYMIWATTQHYADFNYQIKLLNNGKELNKKQRELALENVVGIVLRGVGLNP